MKKTLINMIVYLMLGLGCIIGGGELTESVTTVEIWHDALLVIGGVCMGAFCAMFVLFAIERTKRLAKDE